MNKFGPWMNWGVFASFIFGNSQYTINFIEIMLTLLSQIQFELQMQRKIAFSSWLESNHSIRNERTCLLCIELELCCVWRARVCNLLQIWSPPSPHNAWNENRFAHPEHNACKRKGSSNVNVIRIKFSRWFIRCNRPYACVVCNIYAMHPSGFGLLPSLHNMTALIFLRREKLKVGASL